MKFYLYNLLILLFKNELDIYMFICELNIKMFNINLF